VAIPAAVRPYILYGLPVFARRCTVPDSLALEAVATAIPKAPKLLWIYAGKPAILPFAPGASCFLRKAAFGPGRADLDVHRRIIMMRHARILPFGMAIPHSPLYKSLRGRYMDVVGKLQTLAAAARGRSGPGQMEGRRWHQNCASLKWNDIDVTAI